VVPGTPRDYTSHPTTALLVLEISDTTLQFDRGRKEPLYARAGFEEYWVVTLPDRGVEVHRFPCEGKYSQAWTVDVTGSIMPLAAPHVAIAVDELFP
jgi:Uma2 family endonuclease